MKNSFEDWDKNFYKIPQSKKRLRSGKRNTRNPFLEQSSLECRQINGKAKGMRIIGDALPGDFVRVSYSLGTDPVTNACLGIRTVKGIIGYWNNGELETIVYIHSRNQDESAVPIPTHFLKKVSVEKRYEDLEQK